MRDLAVIGCAPTGSGKSKIMASIALDALKKGKTVLIITEAKKIFDQLAEELEVTNINPEAKKVEVTGGKVYLAMAQTLARRKHLIEAFVLFGLDLIVMNDEAHIGTATKVLTNFVGINYLIGFTATPDYRAAKHLPLLYKDCIQACQVDELIQEGFLCTYRHVARDKNVDLSILELRNGDYTEESNEKAFSNSEVYDGLFEDLEKYPFKKCMIFTASIKQCEETYAQLIENGFKATRYHSELKNADYELAKYTELNLVNICVSVSSLTKGFDYPPSDMVCLLRRTNSLPLYLQMIGRGSRPIYAAYSVVSTREFVDVKTKFIVLDYGGHWKSLGLYWDDRDWCELWKAPKEKKKKDGGGISTVKMCLNCDELITVQSRTCPECGFEYPEIEKELSIGEAIEVTKHYTDLIGKKTSELDPRELSIYAKIKNKQNHAIRISMFQEIRNKGFVKKFGECMGYSRDWVAATTREANVKPTLKLSIDIELK